MITSTTSVIAQNSQAVCFVYHDIGIIFLRQTNDLRQIGYITFHTEYSIYYNQFHCIRTTLLQLLLKRFHVVVLKLKDGRKREATSFNNRSVVKFVTDHIIFTTCHTRNYTQIYLKSCGINDSIFFANKFGQFFLQLKMKVKCTVQKTRSGTTRTIFAGSFNSSLNYFRMISQA
ncbi:unknown [Bacteroides fragilis CAG:558]|nr:unknown [Bacteroides fragilis CAG:558]